LEPILERLKKSGEGAYHVRFSDLILDSRYDPGATRRWQAEGNARWHALRRLCERVAEEVAQAKGAGYQLNVSAYPGDEPAADRREAARQNQARSMEKAHRIRYRWLQELEAEGYTRPEAKLLWSDRHGMSAPTIERSIRFCEEEDDGDAA
jgi:hypothetical protein